jgi:hypothetical protein
MGTTMGCPGPNGTLAARTGHGLAVARVTLRWPPAINGRSEQTAACSLLPCADTVCTIPFKCCCQLCERDVRCVTVQITSLQGDVHRPMITICPLLGQTSLFLIAAGLPGSLRTGGNQGRVTRLAKCSKL